jgi:hypothetical protein
VGNKAAPLQDVIGRIPFRVALAGGWIDQPFVSKLNPTPPGSMVVVAIEPSFRPMDRSGLATGTRNIARKLWSDSLPARSPAELVRELYAAENLGKTEPSGSQDMIGLVYPGINRLDYDYQVHAGVFPAHIESIDSGPINRWLEKVLHLVPVAPRPEGYNPLGEKRLSPEWVCRLGASGQECFEAIKRRDICVLGSALNECMECWSSLLPHTVKHPTLTVDLIALLRGYQAEYPGVMYSGCGGGYLLVISEKPVPGGFGIVVRSADHQRI